MKTQMNIRQAARWAERKGCLYRTSNYNNEPVYLYAVYDADTHMVECLGGYEKCDDYRKSLGSSYDTIPTNDGRHLRMVTLESVRCDLDESEGEARCIPDACEVREWA